MRAGRVLARRVHARLAAIRAHPRHVLLGGLVAGLLAGPLDATGTGIVAALAAALGGRAPLALGAATAVLAGGALADARTAALDRSLLRPMLGREVSLAVVALEPIRRAPSGVRRGRVQVAAGPGAGERVALRIGPWVSAPHVRVGGRLRVRGPLVALGGWQAADRRRNVHAVLLVRSLASAPGGRGGWRGWLDGVRGRAERGLAGGLPPPQAALARGMVLGQDEAIAEPVREDFRRSGLAHLLAVSGQNVMLLAALALPLARAVGLGVRGRLVAVGALIAVYVPLTGAEPPIQRAGVMGAAGCVAGLAGRASSRWYALLLAGAVTLAVSPRSAGDPGWQLSFAAVVGLLAWAGPLARGLRARGVLAGVAEAAAVTVAATAATAPLLAFHFEQVSLASLPANLLAAPAVAPLMWLGMVSAAVGQVSAPAASLVNALNAYPLAYLEWLAGRAADVPGAAVDLRLGSAASVAGAYAALAAVVHGLRACGGRPLRPARVPRPLLAAVLAVAAVPAVATLLTTRSHGPAAPAVPTVSFLDVGQGDATLVRHGDAAVLVDAGPPGGPVVARLREAGVRRLDALVVTHAQDDHQGGAAHVLAAFPVGLLLDGATSPPTPARTRIVAAARRRGARVVVPDAGQVLRIGPLELRVLWPRRSDPITTGGDPNDRAVVLHVRDGPFDLLLPADAESDVTGRLALPRVEALKVAHHGSADPGLPALLERVRPRIAVIEVGRHNSYGHPTPQVLAALRAVPRVYRTDRDGTVTLSAHGRRLAVREAR